ncbi:MAG: hypothetical protein AAGE01_09765 [Pseudomonadota bacterium]
MTLLIVAIVFLIVHYLRPSWPRLRQGLYDAFFRTSHALLARVGLEGAAGFVLLVAIVVAAVAWLQVELAQLAVTWPWFLFSLAALLLAWGGRDLDDDVETFLEATSDQDARAAAAVLLHSYEPSTPGPEQVIRGVFYQALVRWFGVLFWFMVFGAAGAVAFRLPHALLSSAWLRERSAPDQFRLLRRLTRAIDYPPALLSVLALALIGNFDAVAGAWRAHREERGRRIVLDPELLPYIGLRLVGASGPADEAFEDAYAGSRAPVAAAMSLLWRALIAWLTVIALLIIAGLAS